MSQTGDPLERLNTVINWEIFCPILERMDAKVRKSKTGRKPTCRILMFLMLILQQLNGLSYERLQYQVTDRLSFMRFLGVYLAGNVPDARPVRAFREALKEHQLFDALFDRLNQTLAEIGVELKNSQIIDATRERGGGMRISEPASDLAGTLAITASLRGKPLPKGFIAFGEVGLAGAGTTGAAWSGAVQGSRQAGF